MVVVVLVVADVTKVVAVLVVLMVEGVVAVVVVVIVVTVVVLVAGVAVMVVVMAGAVVAVHLLVVGDVGATGLAVWGAAEAWGAEGTDGLRRHRVMAVTEEGSRRRVGKVVSVRQAAWVAVGGVCVGWRIKAEGGKALAGEGAVATAVTA